MLLSRKLLNKYVDVSDIDTDTLCKKLTEAGFEVEGVSNVVKGTNLVVGHVLTCQKHPDSDHLSVCTVDIGESIEQIVCGAPNVAQDQKVIVAKNGAELPGLTIKPTKIRGVESNGMICSLAELGVENDHEGIYVLEQGNPGDDAKVALGIDDEIIDIDLTPNRSDFLGMFAVAKEVGAIFKREVNLPKFDGASHVGSETSLKINSDTEKCSYFSGKVIGEITIKESPDWIKNALNASGIRSINNVVDISNLVMLETGQPLHFYDIDFLNNQTLNVRDDLETTVKALDDKEYLIQKGDLVIMNEDTPVGIAGIMGLGNSMIHEKSRGLIIEVASFDMVSVRKTANRLGLNTESSQRFSKPMDPLAPTKAMDRAVQLLIEYADAKSLEKTVTYGEIEYTPKTVTVKFSKINNYLGTELSKDQVMDVFTRLDLNPKLDHDIITCHIPSYRNDLNYDVDLIEEVIRIIGYDILEETLPKMDMTAGSLNNRQEIIQQIESILLGFGGYQTLTYTLVNHEMTQGFEALSDPIRLMSPMSDNRAYLRTQLWPSLLETVGYNNARRQTSGLYFEISKLYTDKANQERLVIAGHGQYPKENWKKETIDLDFYALKGMFIEMMDHLGFTSKRISFVAEEFDKDAFHPYKTASILLDRKRIGVLGHLHPKLLREKDLNDLVILEVALDEIIEKKKANIKSNPISPYPNVKRDLSILCDKSIVAEALISSIEKSAGRLLKDINVFDVFTSKDLDNKKSIAIEVVLGADHTLSEEEIQNTMNKITNNLETNLNVTIR